MAAINQLHYVEFSGHGSEGPSPLEEVARHVHAFNREHGNTLGVDYPEWQAGQAPAGALTRLRVFGLAATLRQFIGQPRAMRLLAMGEVARSALSPVPADAPLAAVKRDSTADKSKPSHARRRAARGIAPFEGRQATAQLSLSVESKSTGMGFALKLRKLGVAPTNEVGFNSYGLCSTGGLPQF